MKFSEEFEARRKAKNLTYRDLAGKLKLRHHGLLEQYGKGLRFPKPGKIITKISSALDWDEKSIYLAIQQEKAPSSAKKYFDPSQAAYPNLRKLLLDYYSIDILPHTVYKEEFASQQEIREILQRYPLHPAEKIIFSAIYDELIKFNKVPPGIDPIDYFNKLTEAGKKQRIEETKLCWAFNKKHGVIAYKFGKDNLKWAIAMWTVVDGIKTARAALLNLYKPAAKSDCSLEYVNNLLLSDFSYRIETKLLEEINKKLSTKYRVKTFNDFLLLSRESINERLKEAGILWWSYRLDDSLYITFNDNKTIAFKLLWQKIK